MNICKGLRGIKTNSVDEISIIVCWDFHQTTNMPNKQTKPTYIKENEKVNNNSFSFVLFLIYSIHESI